MISQLPSERRRRVKRRKLHHFIPGPADMNFEYVDEKKSYTLAGEFVADDRSGQSKATRRRKSREQMRAQASN